jgi:hypothetical protein
LTFGEEQGLTQNNGLLPLPLKESLYEYQGLQIDKNSLLGGISI